MQQPLEANQLSFKDQFQYTAGKSESEIEKEFDQIFNQFQVVESQPLPQQQSEPEHTSSSMKVRTDDEEDQGHLKLQTAGTDPFSDWEARVEEFFRRKSPFENLLNSFDHFNIDFSNSDVESDVNRAFDTFDFIEYYTILADSERTSSCMKVKTDENGNVCVKKIKKESNPDWQTHVEGYH